MKSVVPAMLVSLIVLSSPAVIAETVSTLTLDGLSYVSFQDEEILPIPAGSTMQFRFGDANTDGSYPFTITPSGVDIGTISLAQGQEMKYGVASVATGTMSPTQEGWRTLPRLTRGRCRTLTLQLGEGTKGNWM